MPALDAVIVGGGIAGLATAYELSLHGTSFVVLERASRAGGVIFSEEIDGYTIDGGPDALLMQKPEGIALCEEIGLGHRLIPTKPPRLAYIQRAGRLHALPAASVLGIPTRVGPFARSGLFSWAGKLRMGAELLVPRRRDDADESIGAFITRLKPGPTSPSRCSPAFTPGTSIDCRCRRSFPGSPRRRASTAASSAPSDRRPNHASRIRPACSDRCPAV
jgi:hypothetical protein